MFFNDTPSLHARFWSRVDTSGDCWEWTGPRDRYGYGKCSMGGGKSGGAHRFAYADTYGPIPDGLCVCHSCDNRVCCRPDHLFLGTNQENTRDRDRKGRQASGDRNGARLYPERWKRAEDHYASKVTWDQVRAIRQRYANGERALTKIGRDYGVSTGIIFKIVHNKSWKESGLDDVPEWTPDPAVQR